MSGFEQDIGHCLAVLNEGGTILYPTDTIWGIGCDATSPEAVEKVFRIKERPAEKSMIVLVAEGKDILKYVANPDPAVFDFIKQASRPTTIVFEGAIGLASNLVATDGSVAIRVVNDAFCRHLIKRFRKPLVSTSANLSGDPAPARFTEILLPVRSAVDYVVHHRQDEEAPGVSSTVVKWNRDGTTTVIRR